jgi:membrane protein insertase Oxa1/YidC/SpoIIIJ
MHINLKTGEISTGSNKFKLKADGTIEASAGKFSGDISGATGTFTGAINVANKFQVDNNGNVSITGNLTLTDTSFFGIENCLNLGIMGAEGQVAAPGSASFIIGIVLAILVGGTMLLLNHFAQKKPSYAKNTHTHNNNQQADQMQSTMKIMNFFMVFMMVFAALSNNGLALYWVFGNIYSIIQGFINRHLNEKKYYKMKKENTIDNLI